MMAAVEQLFATPPEVPLSIVLCVFVDVDLERYL